MDENLNIGSPKAKTLTGDPISDAGQGFSGTQFGKVAIVLAVTSSGILALSLEHYAYG